MDQIPIKDRIKCIASDLAITQLSEQLCRICLRECSDLEQFYTSETIQQYKDCTGFMIRDKEIPKKICHNCLILLGGFSRFKRRAVKIEAALIELTIRQKNLKEIFFESSTDSAFRLFDSPNHPFDFINQPTPDYDLHALEVSDVDEFNSNDTLQEFDIDVSLDPECLDFEDQRIETISSERQELEGQESTSNVVISLNCIDQEPLETVIESQTNEEVSYSHRRLRSQSCRNGIYQGSKIAAFQDPKLKLQAPIKKRKPPLKKSKTPKKKPIKSKKLPKQIQRTSAPPKVAENQNEKRIACARCHKVFSAKRYHRIHTNFVHNDDNHFICGFDGKLFKEKERLKDHMGLVHMAKVPCPDCSKSFAAPRLRYHRMRLHALTPAFVCHHCGKICTLKPKLVEHMISHHMDKQNWRYECKQCGKKVNQVLFLFCFCFKLVFLSRPLTYKVSLIK